MKKILVLDNYDSFIYNLVHYIEKLSVDTIVDIYRNDKISIHEIGKYDKILLSPGPGLPKEAGIMNELIKVYSSSKSILGVCLGHQAIAEIFGGKLKNLNKVYHGVATMTSIIANDELLFQYIPKKILTARYHSWTIDNNQIPDSLQITAVDENNEIMAIKHKTLDVRGVQFHPESILTEYGEKMIENWLNT